MGSVVAVPFSATAAEAASKKEARTMMDLIICMVATGGKSATRLESGESLSEPWKTYCLMLVVDDLFLSV